MTGDLLTPFADERAPLDPRSVSPLAWTRRAKLTRHLGTPSSGPKIANEVGYRSIAFAGKKAQAARVEALVREKGFIPSDLVANEVAWFFDKMSRIARRSHWRALHVGIDDQYFALESVETIASHILSLYGSKVLAYTRAEGSPHALNIQLEKETDTAAVYIHTSDPGVSQTGGTNFEQLIDERFLDVSKPDKAYRLETYRSAGDVSSNLAHKLRCYFVFRCDFVNPSPAEDESDLKVVSDRKFLEKVSANTLAIYQEVMNEVMKRTGPVVECFEVEGSRERRLVVGYRSGTTTRFFSAMSDLYHFYGIYSTRKYVEQFSNGVTIASFYLMPLHGVRPGHLAQLTPQPPIETSIYQVIRETSLVYCLPQNPFFSVQTGHAVQEATYAYVAWIFAQHFLNRLGAAYMSLKNILNPDDVTQANVLAEIRKRLREETFTRQSILESLQAYPDLLRLLYVQFAMTHHTSQIADELVPTLSYQRLHSGHVLSDDELAARIRKTVTDRHDLEIFEALMVFNKSILKTNFFTPTKVALSFRLDARFLPDSEYPTKPFGIFFIVGAEFRGFHVRFKDVARGGVRMIRSRNRENYSQNQRNLFDENYALASTQALKNKDIPEGGSKGTILPDLGAEPVVVFRKYVDAILDLLLKGTSPGIKEPIVDLYKDEEILFLGPDEGTADMMDWAAMHARERGAVFWKSFTTGKSAEKLGGVPHDAFGMTSLSVRQYVLGIYRQLGLKEEEVTKVQTGGPDGDLGSNEILLSKDKTIAIIDGSGVLYDPVGINREELVRLAQARQTISQFDVSKLTAEGYRVLCEDTDVKLPSGELIADGTSFRNGAHLRYSADLLVPCGGRPEAINAGNVSQLWDAENKLHFKYIVEGANLFITQQARLALEKRGCILFKDASANKGGVTSSSLEVLAGLALADEDYIELMTASGPDGAFNDFYGEYVETIQRIICRNAAAEFVAIWQESIASKKPRCVLTDEIGRLLIKLQSELEESNLWDNAPLRKAVLERAIPAPLLRKVGLEAVVARLPETYARSLFSSYIAANYIYRYGPRASQIDFFDFLQQLAQQPTTKAA